MLGVLYDVVSFLIRQTATAVNDYNIANILFIRQIYKVKSQLKHNSKRKL